MLKLTHVLSLTFLLTSGAAFANQAASINDVQKAVDNCQPCGSSDPCACCRTEEEKKACESGNSASLITVPSETGWRVVPRE